MPGIPSGFQFSQIAITAGIAFIASGLVLAILGRRSKNLPLSEVLFIAMVVGFSVLAWRLAGNVAQLNDDPIPPFSPNDLICPIVTYVSLGLYAAFRRPMESVEWERRALY